MSRTLHTFGSYPPDWKEISDRVWAEAGHRCIRCGHPYRKGEHGKGEWTQCDEHCRHGGPIGFLNTVTDLIEPFMANVDAGGFTLCGKHPLAQWRIGTVHHLDGNKANCVWWNLLALCQRCHLTIQATVNPHQPYVLEHDAWFKPYAAGFYAKKYENRDLTRAEAEADLERLLGLERIA